MIDEIQELTPERMSAICRSCHRAGQAGLPWFIIGGGLPNLPTRLAEVESYVERLFDYRQIDRLVEADATVALVDPAVGRQVSWRRDATQLVLDESRGYPFLQQVGKSVWDSAAGPDTITLEDGLVGIAEGQRQLDIGLYA